MPKLTNKEYKARLRKTKSLFGLNILINKSYTKSEKSKITRAYNIYKKDMLALDRFNDIKKFVDININPNKKLKPSQKAKIKKYHDEFKDLTNAKTFVVYKSKNKRKMQAVKDYVKPGSLPGFTVAFVPTRGAKKIKMLIDRKGNVTLQTDFLKSYLVRFDLPRLIGDTDNYITQLIKDNKADSYNLRVGEDRTIADKIVRQSAVEDIKFYMLKYDNFKQWMIGLDVNNFINQKAINKFHDNDDEIREQFKLDMRAIKRKANRAKTKSKPKSKNKK